MPTRLLSVVLGLLSLAGACHAADGKSPPNFVIVYADDSRTQTRTVLHQLRQQGEHRAGVPNRALSDFVAPRDTGLRDYIGAFAVTAGLGVQGKIAEFKAALNDYDAILLESVADRLAEAFAERLHQRVRKELWGYAPDEKLDNTELIKERYRGIRPAPGYPACPDHRAKLDLFRVLDAAEVGMGLTESLAMTPASSVSGFYLAHPDAVYFNVGPIGDDQLADWAARNALDESAARRALAPLLG